MDDLPRTTAEIAEWLGEPDPGIIEATRAWHGDAAVVYAMEQVDYLLPPGRARAFLDLINDMQRRRKGMGDWPLMKFAKWRRA